MKKKQASCIVKTSRNDNKRQEIWKEIWESALTRALRLVFPQGRWEKAWGWSLSFRGSTQCCHDPRAICTKGPWWGQWLRLAGCNLPRSEKLALLQVLRIRLKLVPALTKSLKLRNLTRTDILFLILLGAGKYKITSWQAIVLGRAGWWWGAQLPAPQMAPAAPSGEDEHMEEGSKTNGLMLVTPSFFYGLIHSPLKEPTP